MLAVIAAMTRGGAAAQTTTGTISGRVLDVKANALPGATATAKSPNLQGTREAVTSENGDYILTGLPSGPYTITFSLPDFSPRPAPSCSRRQVLPLEVKLGPAQISEEVTVTFGGRHPDQDRADRDQLLAGSDLSAPDVARSQLDPDDGAGRTLRRGRPAPSRSAVRSASRICSS